MSDIAELGFVIDTAQVNRAAQQLQSLRFEASQLQQVTGGVQTSFVSLDQVTQQLNDSNGKVVQSIKSLLDAQRQYTDALQLGSVTATIWEQQQRTNLDALAKLREAAQEARDALNDLTQGSYWERTSLQATQYMTTLQDQARVLQTTRAEWQSFNEVTAQLSFTSAEGQRTFQQLSDVRTLDTSRTREQQAALQALGVQVRDANGQLRSQADILAEVANKASQFADSVQKTRLLQQALGPLSAEQLATLNQGVSVSGPDREAAAEADRFQKAQAYYDRQLAQLRKQREEVEGPIRDRLELRGTYGTDNGLFNLFQDNSENSLDRTLQRWEEFTDRLSGDWADTVQRMAFAWRTFEEQPTLTEQGFLDRMKSRFQHLRQLAESELGDLGNFVGGTVSGDYQRFQAPSLPDAPRALPGAAVEANRQTEQLLGLADAYNKSNVAVLTYKAALEASTAAGAQGLDQWQTQQLTLSKLGESYAQATVQVDQQKSSILDNLMQHQAMARAAGESSAALAQTSINNQAYAMTAQAMATAEAGFLEALRTGNDADVWRQRVRQVQELRDTLREYLTDTARAQQEEQANTQRRQLQDQQELRSVQLQHAGDASSTARRALIPVQARQQVDRQYPLLSPEQRQGLTQDLIQSMQGDLDVVNAQQTAAAVQAYETRIKAAHDLAEASRSGAEAVRQAEIANKAYEQSLRDGGLDEEVARRHELELLRLSQTKNLNLEIEQTRDQIQQSLDLAAAYRREGDSLQVVQARYEALAKVRAGSIAPGDQGKAELDALLRGVGQAATSDAARGAQTAARADALQMAMGEQDTSKHSARMRQYQDEVKYKQDLATADAALARAQAEGTAQQVQEAQALRSALAAGQEKQRADAERLEFLTREQGLLTQLHGQRDQARQDIVAYNDLLAQNKITQEEWGAAVQEAYAKAAEASRTFAGGAEAAMRRYAVTAMDSARQGSELANTTMSALEDGLVNVSMGYKSMGDAALGAFMQIAQGLERIAMQRMVLGPLADMLFPAGGGGLFSSLFSSNQGVQVYGNAGAVGPFLSEMPVATGSAQGNVFGPGGLQHFAQGAVFNTRQVFHYDQGGTPKLGDLAEAGRSEAVLPLVRGPNGDLGVSNFGGGGGGDGGVTVQIFDQRSNANSSPVSTQSSKGPDGKMLLRVMIADESKRNMRTGAMDAEMRANYGVARQGVNR